MWCLVCDIEDTLLCKFKGSGHNSQVMWRQERCTHLHPGQNPASSGLGTPAPATLGWVEETRSWPGAARSRLHRLWCWTQAAEGVQGTPAASARPRGPTHVATAAHTGNFLNSASSSSVQLGAQPRLGHRAPAWKTRPDPWRARLHPTRVSLHIMRTGKWLCPDLSSLRTRHRKLFCAPLFLLSVIVTFNCICLGQFQRKIIEHIHLL